MATTTYVEYTGNGVNGKSFSFASYKEADIKVRVDKVLKTATTHYTISNYTTTGGGQIDFTSGNIPGSGTILIYRDTEVDSPKADYQVGASLKAADLDNNQTQCLYALQEEQNQLVQTYHIKDDAINGTKIADESIDSEHYVDGSIDSAHIANDQIDSQHYAAGSIDFEHMSANSINSDQYVDGSIDSAHIANDQINSQHYAADSIDTEHYAAGSVDGTAIANDAVDSQHYAADSIDTEHYAPGSVDTAAMATGALDGRYYTETELDAGQLDNRYFTETESDARYYQISSSDDIQSTETWAVSDTKVPTTKAVDARVITLVDEVGGFVPITNESDFPATNPDINSAAGTIVSIGVLSTSYTSSGSGVITIPASTLDNLSNDLTITGAANSTTYGPNFGMLVETKALSDAAYAAAPSYTFHRLLPKASEVTTLAGKATELGRLGTAAAVEDMSILGTTACVADMAILGTSDVVADLAILGTADVVADLNTLGTADVVSDLNTLATSDIVADMDAIAPKIADVETVADNIAAVESFADLYQIDDFSPSAPTTDGGGNAVAEGDLAYDSTANELKVYTGSAWEAGVTAPSTLMPKTGGTFTGDVTWDNGTNAGKDMIWDESDDTLKLNDDVQLSLGSDRDMRFYHTGSHAYLNVVTGDLNIRTNGSENAIICTKDAGVATYYNGNKKTETTNTGIDITGNVVVSGTVDGRDLQTDGTKLDAIEASATADQTNAEIRTAVEAATDSNVFTDDDHSKLNAIEASATADQTDAEIRAAVEAATDSNVFTDTDHSKLNAIEASADVTDATNVNAAGAVMESDVDVKGDIFAATADNTVSRLAVGSNNHVLTVDSSEATGLKWAATAGGTPEGEALLSTTNSNEADTKFLRADGDGTCSWQIPPDTNTQLSNAQVRTAVEAATDSNVFTDDDHTKLNAIAASANNYVHPNHSGEVTSTADGATVIASQVVDEDNLYIDNAGSNGQFLQKQSGGTGGLLWATVGSIWESKTSSFTAEAQKNYFCDTSGGAIDVTLPSGTIGDEIHFLDVSATFDTNDLTILNGSSKIQGVSANLDVTTERAGLTLVYYNSTQGWLLKYV